MVLFLVKNREARTHEGIQDNVITFANEREGAKRAAHPHLLGNPDNYIVEPLTTSGDRVTFVTGGAWVQT